MTTVVKPFHLHSGALTPADLAQLYDAAESFPNAVFIWPDGRCGRGVSDLSLGSITVSLIVHTVDRGYIEQELDAGCVVTPENYKEVKPATDSPMLFPTKTLYRKWCRAHAVIPRDVPDAER